MKKEIGALLKKYRARKSEIEQRLLHFKKIGMSSPQTLFEELAFCMLTPQSKAFSCDQAIEELKQRNLLFTGGVLRIRDVLSRKTRFHNKKAVYLVGAREKFASNNFALLKKITFEGSEQHARGILLREVKGIGWKEASHYLRNLGRGKSIAILDRHILKNLVKYGAIRGLPKSLTAKRYLEIERRMSLFCKKIGIPMSHLDLLFWAEETGKVFK
ncbi:MAG: N-glycosylase/DNA lyase [Candidatus Diapherotrites archaeon]|nr:N-glycosylase/DNA lyase [Candidatus Diapherotrites archaeon]